MRMRLSAPRSYSKKMQPYCCMGISEHTVYPWKGGFDFYAKLLSQLARQRMERCLSSLDLATGKFPVTGPYFSGGALGKQEGAVMVLQDCGGNFDDFRFFGWVVQRTLSAFQAKSNPQEAIGC